MMKTKITPILLSAVLLFTISSCKRPGDVVNSRCENLTEDYGNKVTAFSSAPSQSSCTAMVNSLTELINKCSILTAAERKQYNDSLDSIDCSVF